MIVVEGVGSDTLTFEAVVFGLFAVMSLVLRVLTLLMFVLFTFEEVVLWAASFVEVEVFVFFEVGTSCSSPNCSSFSSSSSRFRFSG
jgi:hypothetical protein